MNKGKNVLIVLGFALCVCLLIVASVYDLQISKALYSNNNFYAKFFDYFGELPLYSLIPFSLCIVYINLKEKGTIPCLLLSFFCMVIAYCVTSVFFHRFFGEFIPFYLIALISIALVLCMVYLLGKAKDETKKKLLKFAMFTLVFSGIILVLNEGVKLVWGRCRFYDMALADDYSKYTNWWQINGITGDKSFYSGHTTSAMSLICLLPLARLFNLNSKKYNVLHILIYSFVVLVAFSRIVYGAHFLSDVIVAIIVVSIVYLISIKTFGKRCFQVG